MGSEEHKTLYQLFQEELKLHLAALEEALAGGASDRRTVDAMVLAAHSMKGAARIISANVAADLTGAVEHLLTAVRAGHVEFDGPPRSAVQSAAVWLRYLEPLEETAALAFMAGQAEIVRRLTAQLVAARG
ncbi:MAG: Hpt domain-containing protein [Deltaproteobacteria bacterium]|nr:Hpt domain-containing protein [Deltaproteobacteria bacterium]